MALEFRQGLVPDALKTELAVDAFLALFDQKIPLIPATIFEAMEKEEGLAHFAALAEIEAAFSVDELDALINLSRKLPLLDALLPHFEAASLEQYHLFELHQFLTVTQELAAFEEALPVADACRGALDALMGTLERRTVCGRSLVMDGAVNGAKSKLAEVEKEVAAAISDHEKEVEKVLGLRMLYPFPREMDEGDVRLEKAEASPHLRVSRVGEYFRIDHVPGEALVDLELKKQKITAELEEVTGLLLGQINQELVAHVNAFKTVYFERKRRCLLYSLVFTKLKENFCLPQFEETSGCTFQLEGGLSFALTLKKGPGTVPLSLSLGEGANVLYGANMSGKTTVLKSVFFLLTAIRAGLPVPAGKIKLSFPESVRLLLKSSGDLTKDLSSFGEELAFFAEEPARGAFVLVDELFLSTDPVNGAELSRIFIEEYAKRELIFLATTHYPKVLEMKEAKLFRMLDVDVPEGATMDLSNLASLMPYQLEEVSSDRALETVRGNRAPLKLALCFDLPQSIKNSIQSKLNASVEK